jgi:ABC-type uncharacterized transport system permease subunit
MRFYTRTGRRSSVSVGPFTAIAFVFLMLPVYVIIGCFYAAWGMWKVLRFIIDTVVKQIEKRQANATE